MSAKEPQFPQGGIHGFYQFIGNNIQYPVTAQKFGVEGRVMARYTILKDGSISDIEVIEGIGAGCDEEAIRVLALSPKWEPALKDGIAINFRVNTPIKIQFSREC